MVKIGDRVRFLNSVGGGVVTRFIKKDLVGVLEDDGFEIPVLDKECVVIEDVNRLNFPVKNPVVEQESVPHVVQVPSAAISRVEEVWEESEETEYGDQISLYLGFVPSNIKNLFNSTFDLFLINDSNYAMAYSYAVVNHKKECNCRENGVAYPNTKLFLETLDKESLNKIQQIVVQAIAFKKKGSYQPKPVLDCAVKLPIADFNKLHSFDENDFFEENSLIITLLEKDIPAAFVKPDPEEIKKAMLQKEIPTSKSPVVAKKREKHQPVIEVDLHIHKLLDNTAGMDNAAMLDYQMDKFRQTLAENKNKRGQKIVFIHGKGEGVLRKEIQKELKLKFPEYYVQDASFREYGFGATMVTIR